MGRWGTHPNYQKNHDWYELNRERVLASRKQRHLELVAGQETLPQRNRRLKVEGREAAKLARHRRGLDRLQALRDASEHHEATTVIRDYKQQNPCDDCGLQYPSYVMDFDHVRGVKTADISRMLSRLSRGTMTFERILDEIAKCDLVCANCHRKRTFTRSNHTN